MNKINPEIFKMFDIRGIFPQELNEKTAYQIGRCFVHFLRKETKKDIFKIAIGKDVRPSSPVLFKALSKGICEEGCDIIDLGLIATPMLYFAVSHFGYDAGIIITASHNPNPFNGMKLTREKAIPLSGEMGLFWMRNFLEKNQFIPGKNAILPKGKISKKNIEKEYLDINLKLAGVKKGELKGFSLAIDAGNGIGGPIALKILKNAGVKVKPLYCEPDGSFPNHAPDPLIQKNLTDIISLLKKENFDFGVALDGDADRIIFINEKGRPIPGDLITALMAKIILNDGSRKGARPKILYDIRSSNIVGETIKKEKGKAVPFRIGHSLIKAKMREDNIVFAGESSGHYYWGQGVFYEAPFLVLLKILKEMKKRKTKFSSLINPYQKYYHSGEINFRTDEKENKIKKIKEKYRDGKQLEIDGLRVDYKDWWFLLRASNTEPVLRLVLEAKTEKVFQEKKKELISAIGASIINEPPVYKILETKNNIQ